MWPRQVTDYLYLGFAILGLSITCYNNIILWIFRWSLMITIIIYSEHASKNFTFTHRPWRDNLFYYCLFNLWIFGNIIQVHFPLYLGNNIVRRFYTSDNYLFVGTCELRRSTREKCISKNYSCLFVLQFFVSTRLWRFGIQMHIIIAVKILMW